MCVTGSTGAAPTKGAPSRGVKRTQTEREPPGTRCMFKHAGSAHVAPSLDLPPYKLMTRSVWPRGSERGRGTNTWTQNARVYARDHR